MTLRPLLLATLLSAAPLAAAQFTSGTSTTPSAHPDSRPQIPAFSLQIPDSRLQIPDSRLQIPVLVPRRTLSGLSHLLLLPPRKNPLLPQKNPLVASNSTCYTMRSYEFSQPEAASGISKPSGVTTCQPASSTHLKTTVLAPARLR